MSVWRVERQVMYTVEADSAEDAIALSYLVECDDEISVAWETDEVKS